MARKYTTQTLKAISNRQTVVDEEGLEIVIKPIPETDEAGVLDPRFYQSMAPMFKGIKGFLVKQMMKRGARKKKSIEESARQMRSMMNGVKSVPIVDSVRVQKTSVKTPAAEVPVRIYTPVEPSDTLRPVFYYIHGGGFVAGSPDVVEEMCKLVVEKIGCVAVQPDYRLAPENSFPAGLDDCYEVLKWVAANVVQFGGDGQKICISGDSAGGNLATVCAMRSRDDKMDLVKAEALLYPSVDAAGMAENMARTEVYEVGESQGKVIRAMLEGMGSVMGSTPLGEYLGVKDDAQPYVSPCHGDLAGMPPTMILYGEYDFLRVENDAYARKLLAAGVPVKVLRYKGLSHGFADQVGVTPQAEDALEEVGRFMLEHTQ